MEDYSILSKEEEVLLENLINKLTVSGLSQYNTQSATILFKNDKSLREKTDDLDETNTIKNSKAASINQIEEIKDDLEYIDDYVTQMQDMLKSKPIITNLGKIREFIEVIN